MMRLGTLKTGLATLAVAAVPFAIAASPAAACTVNGFTTCTTVTETVGAGSLTLTSPSNVQPTGITFGTDQTNSYTLDLNTGDNTGSGAGWNEALSQTPFTASTSEVGGTSTLPTAETIASAATFTAVGASTLPTPSAANLTAVTAGGSSAVIANAGTDTGEGNFTSSPAVTFTVPANTYAGSYTAVAEVVYGS